MNPSRSKYHARKVTVDGITFASRKEAARYQELRLLERAGAISDLRLQERFELIPSQRINGKVVERPVSYVADFVYTEDGATVVEDVKGYTKSRAYDVFVIKRKLMLEKHGIQIREV